VRTTRLPRRIDAQNNSGNLPPIATPGLGVEQAQVRYRVPLIVSGQEPFAVSGNQPSLWWFFNEVRRLWLMSLRRRSQKARLSWEKFIQLVDRFFPPIETLHALPCHRFDARTRGRSPVR
jgi:hypothetical protein